MAGKIWVSTRKGLFELAKTAGAWRVQEQWFLGDNVTLALPAAGGEPGFAALEHGHFGVKLWRHSAAAGWQEAPRPVLPPRAEGAPPEQTPDGKPLPERVEKIWSLARCRGERAATLYAGTIPGALFVSRDSGESWALVDALWQHEGRKQWFGGGAEYPGIHSICIDPRSNDCLRVGVSCGGVWQSDDAGKTWNVRASGMRAEFMPPERQLDPNIQDVHCVVQCAAQPDYLWAQHHNGIYFSRDGARSWTEITNAQPSRFGFVVAVHPAHGEKAWFVPAHSDQLRIPVDGKLVVSQTRDGGQSFEVTRRGLPAGLAFDLVYRHSLDVDESGERLGFGSTSGGVWISEDGGASFAELDARLPPVHALRFCN